MGNVTCAQCGRVRLTPETSCPECGASPREILGPPTALVQSPPKRRRFFDTSWREIRPRAENHPLSPRRRLELAAGLGSTAVLLAVVVVVYYLLPGPGGPYVLIEAGTTIGVPQGAAWQIGGHGALQGAFTVTNGSAEVCFADYDMFGYAVAHKISFDQCPSNSTYSSGFVTSGGLSGSFGPGNIYLQNSSARDGTKVSRRRPLRVPMRWRSSRAERLRLRERPVGRGILKSPVVDDGPR